MPDTTHHARLLAEIGSTWRDHHEPSAWLRLRALAAAVALAADGEMPPGRHILPLVRGTDPARCIRCPKPGTHQCGFEYVSTWHPGATLCLTFSLCQVHAAAEYGVQA